MKRIKQSILWIWVCALCIQPMKGMAVEHISFSRFDLGEVVFTEAPPLEQPADLHIPAKSSILIEATSGRILYQNNENELLPPASITKIMTLLLTMEDIAAKKIKLEDQVNVSPHAMSMGCRKKAYTNIAHLLLDQKNCTP